MSKNKLEVSKTALWPRDPLPEPRVADDLEPGERKRKEKFRQKTVGDLLVPFAFSVIVGAGTAGIANGLGANEQGAILAGSITLLVSFVSTGLRIVFTDGASVLELAETVTRVDLNGDNIIGSPREVMHRYHVTVQLRKGTHIIYTDLGIVSEAQALAWHEFCKAVVRGERQFTGNEAEDAGVDRGWFGDVLVPQWAKRDTNLQLIDPDTVGPKKTMRLTEKGEETIKAFARIPPTPRG